MRRGRRVGSPPGENPGRWRNRFARFVVFATLSLIFAGGMVTSTGSGLAVPDWPLSYGQVFPQEYVDGLSPSAVGVNRGVFFEHSHRMIAAAVGLLTVILAIWFARAEPRRWVRRLAWSAVALVIAQGVLGGITVLAKLPAAVSSAHAGLANLFLLVAVALAVVTGRWWRAAAPAAGRTSGLARLSLLATGVIYIQILLGAVMRHTGSGLAIPDFPLAFGSILPPLDDPRVAIHFAHRLGALAAAAVVLAVIVRAVRRHRGEWDLVVPAALLGALTAAQGTLGAYVVWTYKAVNLTTLHVLCGSATLAASFLLALRAARKEGTVPARAPARDLASAEGRA